MSENDFEIEYESKKIKDIIENRFYRQMINFGLIALEVFMDKYLKTNAEDKPCNKIANKTEGSCVICLDSKASILIQPCKHLCLCEVCSKSPLIINCPICREDIEDKIPIFLC